MAKIGNAEVLGTPEARIEFIDGGALVLKFDRDEILKMTEEAKTNTVCIAIPGEYIQEAMKNYFDSIGLELTMTPINPPEEGIH